MGRPSIIQRIKHTDKIHQSNKIHQSKDERQTSNACYRCGIIEHFVRDCNAGTSHTTDDAASSAVFLVKCTQLL